MNISIKDLTVSFAYPRHSIEVVHRCNMEFREGRITGIVGESGCGKSVLGMSLLQLLPSNAVIEGQCLYGEASLLSMNGKALRHLRRDEIALIPQSPYESLNPSWKIGKILNKALKSTMPKAQRTEEIDRILLRLGFEHPAEILKSYSFELSGGMNQRVLASLALLRHPKWILADEPTKGLDTTLAREVLHMFREIAQEVGSLIIITHDLELARALCDDLAVMYDGEIVETGPCRQILTSPRHPYTAGLLRALPSKGMNPIPPSFRECPPGACRFYPRCPAANASCENHPDFTEPVPGWKVRCCNHA